MNSVGVCGRFLSFLHLCMYQLKEIFSLNEPVLGLIIRFSDPVFSFGHNNCLKNRSNGKCNNILNILKTLAQTKLLHLINLLSLFPDFVFSFANVFLH